MFRKAQHEQSLVGEVLSIGRLNEMPENEFRIGRDKGLKSSDLYEACVLVGSNDSYVINDSWDFEKLPHSEKVQDFDEVNKPAHYNYGAIEVIDYAEQVCKQYPPELAPHIFNAIKYLSRAEDKGGKQDIEKARYYVQRIFDKWDGAHK